MMARATGDGMGHWQEAHHKARREREARNDLRSRDIFRGISALKACVALEAAQRNADQISRREACGGRGRDAGGGSFAGRLIGTMSRSSPRLSTNGAENSRTHCCDQNHRQRRSKAEAKRLPLSTRGPSSLCAAGETHRGGEPGRTTCEGRTAKICGRSIAQGSGEARVAEGIAVAAKAASAAHTSRKRSRPGYDSVIDLSDREERPLRTWLPPAPGGPPAPTAAATSTSCSQLSSAEKAVQRRPWGMEPPQRRPARQQQNDFPSAVSALPRQEQSGGVENITNASAPTDEAKTSPLGRAGKSCIGQKPQQQQQPPFVVVGLIGEFGDRVLLLPTTKERRKAMKATSGAAVPLTWLDAEGAVRTATLTRTKAKPLVCNPLPMLATMLVWMREFSAGVLPEARCPILPECLLERQRSFSGTPLHCKSGSGSCSSSNSNNNRNDEGDKSHDACLSNSSSTSNSIKNKSSSNAGSELSLAAAWLLAHLTFGRDSDGEQQSVFVRASLSPNGKVNLSGGEAAALALLRCPLIGWSPQPDEVMEALAEGEGNLCAYSVSPSEFDVGVGVENAVVSTAAAAATAAATKDVGWGSEARKAAAELVRAGLARTFGAGRMLTLAQTMEGTCELVLRIFLGAGWDPDRGAMARIALGLVKTGPMTRGVHPSTIPSLFEAARGAQQQARCSCDRTASACPDEKDGHERVIGGQSARIGRMGGIVGDMCVKLHQWCFEVLRPPRNSGGIDLSILEQISKNEVGDNPASPLIWSGLMSRALGLLGGATGLVQNSTISDGDKNSSVGTVSIGCENDWMATLSREERLRDPACLRLKEASARVLGMMSSVVEGLQKQKMYGQAVTLLRLLVRGDQGLAGREYAEAAPDLLWAADWVTSNHRGYVYTRLAINLKHLKQPGRRQLEVVRDACEDEDVRGGERMELRERYRKLQRDHGDSQDSPAKDQQYRAVQQTVIVRMHTQKEGNRKSNNGGRKLYFDKPDRDQQRWGEKNALNVEQVLRRERYRSGGWLGVHCESSLIMFLSVLLLWEEIFDPEVTAGFPHCSMNRPADLLDKFFFVRRKGLSSRLLEIYRSSDEALWTDVGLRYERYKGVTAVWCDWRRFPKQQVMEISVAFGGRRLFQLLRTTTSNISYLRCGFPDVVMWRPKSPKGRVQRASGSGRSRSKDSNADEKEHPWDSRTHFGLGWQGHGFGWEVEVVEVKSKGDIISDVQKAWLMELENARVPAMVARVLAENEVA